MAVDHTEATSPVPPPGPSPTGAHRPRVLYLAGLGRSGTTLLERMIGALPGAWPVGESVFLWQRGVADNQRCGCGERFHDCPFWTAVGERAFGGWSALDLDRVAALERAIDDVRHVPKLLGPRPSPRTRSLVDDYADLYTRLYAAVRDVSGCSVVVDSSKRTSLAYCLRRAGTVDLRVLHAVRDSRGVAYSWTKVVRRPEVVDREEQMPRYSPTYMALLWNGHNALLDLLRVTGTPTILLRYEDLVADPVGRLRAVAGFAGLATDPASLSFVRADAVDLGPAHTVSGNPMRFATGTIPIRRDDQWRVGMPAGQRRAVSALTAPWRVRYGYAGRRADAGAGAGRRG